MSDAARTGGHERVPVAERGGAPRRTGRALLDRCRGLRYDDPARMVDLAREGRLTCDVTVLSDGEEEIGGDSVVRWLEANDEPHVAAIVFDAIAPGQTKIAVTATALACVTSALFDFLPLLVRALRDARPDAAMAVQEMDTADAVEALGISQRQRSRQYTSLTPMNRLALSPVPEPTTLVLTAVGMLGFGVLARRRAIRWRRELEAGGEPQPGG